VTLAEPDAKAVAKAADPFAPPATEPESYDHPTPVVLRTVASSPSPSAAQPPHHAGVGLIQLPGATPPEAPQPPTQALPSDKELETILGPSSPSPTPSAGQAAPSAPPKLMGYHFGRVKTGEEVEFIPLKPVPMSIGSQPGSTIHLNEADVAPRHARITTSGDTVTIWDMGSEVGLWVNGERCASAPLAPYDLVKLGDALLVYLPNYGNAAAPEMAHPSKDQTPLATFTIAEGQGAGRVYYLMDRPLLVGSHAAATVRLQGSGVDSFHAHIHVTKAGIELTDLRSHAGVIVNNRPSSAQVVRSGDRVFLGRVTLKVLVREPGAAPAAKTAEPDFELVDSSMAPPPAAPSPAPSKKKKDDSSDLDIPADVEVNEAPETLLDLSLAAPAAHAAKTPAAPRGPKPATYGAGELAITCIEGGSQGTTWPINQTNMIMGRDRHAPISIRDLSVSRQHASIVIGPRGIEVRDLGSRNGIYVNGQKSSSSVLKPGDTIRLGQCVFLVDLAS